MKKPNELDYTHLGFSYTETPYNVRCHYRNGEWGEIEVTQDVNVSMHIASTALHYGQQAFEGLKARMGADGKVRIFRLEENAKRMQRSADYLEMAQPPIELFNEAVLTVVKHNIEYVAPYGVDGSLYIRPVLFGVGATVGIRPSDEYMLVIFVTPVGQYFPKGKAPGLNILVDRDHDRSGAHGTGHIKAGGNYASSLKSGVEAYAKGYNSVLYLDPIEHKYIDECGAANFFAIKDNKYITPVSSSILQSITNMSLQDIARDLGLEVECRKIDFKNEIETFEEIGACGTAAIIAQINSIYDPQDDKTYEFSGSETIKRLLERYFAIQNGTYEDTHNWMTVVE